jgi:hypothetical protein
MDRVPLLTSLAALEEAFFQEKKRIHILILVYNPTLG